MVKQYQSFHECSAALYLRACVSCVLKLALEDEVNVLLPLEGRTKRVSDVLTEAAGYRGLRTQHAYVHAPQPSLFSAFK